MIEVLALIGMVIGSALVALICFAILITIVRVASYVLDLARYIYHGILSKPNDQGLTSSLRNYAVRKRISFKRGW